MADRQHAVVFMGTAPLACASLDALTRHPGCTVHAVVTQPDRPRGRRLQLQPSAVKSLALEKGIPVLQPAKARDPEFFHQLGAFSPDLIVVAAYGQILPQSLLSLPRFGCLNVHTSLLPKYRGAAPIQWALLNGDAETGVTLMKMDAGLDTGDILSQAITPILPEDNATTLHERLAGLGAGLLIQTLDAYLDGSVQPRPQQAEQASYARKLSKEDGRLNWSEPATALWNRVRALNPWPGTFTTGILKGHASVLKILEARLDPRASGRPGTVLEAGHSGVVVACGDGGLVLTALQLEGGKRLGAQQFLAGHPLAAGAVFGEDPGQVG